MVSMKNPKPKLKREVGYFLNNVLSKVNIKLELTPMKKIPSYKHVVTPVYLLDQ